MAKKKTTTKVHKNKTKKGAAGVPGLETLATAPSVSLGLDPVAVEAFGFLKNNAPPKAILSAFKSNNITVDAATADHFLEIVFRWVPQNTGVLIRVFVDGEQIISTSAVGGSKRIDVPANKYSPGDTIAVQTAVTFLNDGWKYRTWVRGLDANGTEVFRGPATDEIGDPDPSNPDDNIDVREFAIPLSGGNE